MKAEPTKRGPWLSTGRAPCEQELAFLARLQREGRPVPTAVPAAYGCFTAGWCTRAWGDDHVAPYYDLTPLGRQVLAEAREKEGRRDD